MAETVVVIGTGGTIASMEPNAGVVVKTFGSADLLGLIQPIPNIETEGLDFRSNYPMGWDIDWSLLCDLSSFVREHLARPEVAGVVITHGTDVLEEVACFLQLTLETDKPVVVTGAMLNQSQPGFDGGRNLHDAIRLAATGTSGLGVCVAFNGTVIAGIDATKGHTTRVNSFASPNGFLLGHVDRDRISIRTHDNDFPAYAVSATEAPSVPLLWTYVGAPAGAVSALSDEADALVIAGTGMGHVPSSWMPLIREFSSSGRPVLIASRCGSGSTGLGYAGAGGDLDLQDAGVLWAGDRRPLHARIELMCALSAGLSLPALRPVFP
ncbi:asparaginase [Paenarthrobacter sp. NPDC091669]|uniref:asparaginase n=1 Tax=Paenarthrobacter sp. NPDC091669 TaxID=3364384 RepID=UPI0037F7A17A